MTAPYQPEVGHRVRGTVEGVVTMVGSSFVDVDGLTRAKRGFTWERLPDPEPEWQYGDVVRDAEGVVLIRTKDARWWYGPQRIDDEGAIRPLTRLVPEATS